jgi:hypothetical protein
VKDSGASSTQPLDHEDVDELCAKCTSAAKEWESHAILLRNQYIWKVKDGGMLGSKSD